MCVLGLGLIGGSLMRAGQAAGREVFGYNRSIDSVTAARAEGFDVTDNLTEALQRAAETDALIVLARLNRDQGEMNMALVYFFIIHMSRYGNWIFAMGGDRESARNVGIPTDKVTIILFVASSTSAAASAPSSAAAPIVAPSIAYAYRFGLELPADAVPTVKFLICIKAEG